MVNPPSMHNIIIFASLATSNHLKYISSPTPPVKNSMLLKDALNVKSVVLYSQNVGSNSDHAR